MSDVHHISRRQFISRSGRAAAASMLSPFVGLPPGFAPTSCYAGDQYKRRGLDAMAKIADGRLDAAVHCLTRHLKAYPQDPEFYYGLTTAHTQRGETTEALSYAEKALDAGLPVSRLLAGPRALLAPLHRHSEFEDLVAEAPELVHGPLLGNVTPRSAQVWVRTFHEAPIQIVASPDSSSSRLSSDIVRTDSDSDYTAVTTLEELRPNTRYRYRVQLDGQPYPQEWSFRTFPPEGESAAFDIGFGGCAGYTPWHERIWDTIAGYQFPAFLLTGDNVYIDNPTRPDVQRYCYYRRQSHPAFRRLTPQTAIYTIWDDHDFGTNDSWGGPGRFQPSWKTEVWRTFVNNWNNPYYAGGESQPGCWFTFSIADVDFFMLDDRYYRTDPQDPSPSMLGPAQKEWLFQHLRQSEATFKLIVTSVPWAYGVKPGSADPWQGYKEERDELFSFLHEHRVEGVILLAGDRHRADIWRIERQRGYPLYSLENARLTNVHTHSSLPGALFSYNMKCTFGRLRFDTTRPDPEVHYEVITIDDDLAYDFTLKHSQLSYS